MICILLFNDIHKKRHDRGRDNIFNIFFLATNEINLYNESFIAQYNRMLKRKIIWLL